MTKIIASKRGYLILEINEEGKVVAVKCASWSGSELSFRKERKEITKTKTAIKLAEVVLLRSRPDLVVDGDDVA